MRGLALRMDLGLGVVGCDSRWVLRLGRGLALGWRLDQELAFLASMRRLAGVKARERGRLEKIGLPSALVNAPRL